MSEARGPTSSPLRVVLLDSIPGWGGGEKWCVEAARALAARGHRVVIACEAQSTLGDRARAAGIETWSVALRGWRGIAAAFELGRRLREERIEIVLANVGRDLRAGAIACGRSGASLVQRRGIARRIKRDPVTTWVYRRVRLVIANCAAIRDEMLLGGGPLPAERFAVIENGVPTATPGDRRLGREQLGVPLDARLAVVVGRLAPMKGHAGLLRAWRAVLDRVPNAVLVLAGDGESGAELRELARKLRLGESVRFAGFVRELADLYAAADLFVLPSERDEGCNNALLEAMSHGLAAVVTRCGGLPECVEDGVTGRVVAIGDENGLSRAIAELLADSTARARLGAAAKARAQERFAPERVTAELELALLAVREHSAAVSDRARTSSR